MRKLVLLSAVALLLPACHKVQEAELAGPKAPQLYEEAIVKLSYAASRPQGESDKTVHKVHHLRGEFDAACEQNDVTAAAEAGAKLIAIQRNLLGDRASDVSGSIAKLAETYVRSGTPQDALDMVNKQLELLGKISDVEPESAHGVYHLLVARFKAAKALNLADVSNSTKTEAVGLRKKFGGADCCEDISAL